jgi:hypothetical protein
MKFFKIDEAKLFEKYFDKMTVKEFFELESIPDGVDEMQMRNMGEFLKKVKSENVEQDLSGVTIGEVLIQIIIQNEGGDEFSHIV